MFLNTPIPAVVDAGGGSFTVTLTGNGFVTGSVARWMGLPLATIFVSSRQLSASVPASAITVSGIYELTVMAPGGAVSNRALIQVLPVLKAISPTEGPAGTAATLTAAGMGFGPDCFVREVKGGGQFFATVATSTKLTAIIPPATLGLPGERMSINVGCPGGMSTAILTFEAKAPTIRTLSPVEMSAGGPQFALTVNGSSFAPGALLKWGDRWLPSTLVQDTRLLAEIPPDLTVSEGVYSVRVENPGGFASNAVSFTVGAAPLVVRTVTPGYAVSSSSPFLLTIRGTGFRPDAIIEWNGSPLSSTFISSTELIGGVTADLIAVPGVARIRVRLATGISNAVEFPIRGVPAVQQPGISNTGSGTPPVAPGSLFTIYGFNLAVSEAATTGPNAPTTLNGTSVQVDGIPAPLLYVSRNQINAQLPYDVSPGIAYLVVKVGGLESEPAPLGVYPIAPGVWRVPGTTDVLAVNHADGKLNSAEDPVRPGEFATIFLTGQGMVTNPIPAGAAAPESPLSLSVAPVVAKVGGQPGSVSFAGLAPGLIGLLQMNLQIPDVPPGKHLLEISIGDVPANSGTTLKIHVGSPQ